jgi:hypothetical protein
MTAAVISRQRSHYILEIVDGTSDIGRAKPSVWVT